MSLVVHAALEIPALAMITANPDTMTDSFLWQHWRLFHGFGGSVLIFSFLVLGFFLGRRFWQILYVERRYGTPRW